MEWPTARVHARSATSTTRLRIGFRHILLFVSVVGHLGLGFASIEGKAVVFSTREIPRHHVTWPDGGRHEIREQARLGRSILAKRTSRQHTTAKQYFGSEALARSVRLLYDFDQIQRAFKQNRVPILPSSLCHMILDLNTWQFLFAVPISPRSTWVSHFKQKLRYFPLYFAMRLPRLQLTLVFLPYPTLQKRRYTADSARENKPVVYKVIFIKTLV